MAEIVAAFLVHHHDCPVRRVDRGVYPARCNGCEPTHFIVEAEFDPPATDDVAEGIRRARVAAMDAAVDYVAEHNL